MASGKAPVDDGVLQQETKKPVTTKVSELIAR